jgi:hypothetical protein
MVDFTSKYLLYLLYLFYAIILIGDFMKTKQIPVFSIIALAVIILSYIGMKQDRKEKYKINPNAIIKAINDQREARKQ